MLIGSSPVSQELVKSLVDGEPRTLYRVFESMGATPSGPVAVIAPLNAVSLDLLFHPPPNG